MTQTRIWGSARLFREALRQKRVPFYSRKRLAAIQKERVRRIARHAYESVPFYRQAMAERGLRPEDFRDASDLKRLPLIDKQVVQENGPLFQSTALDPASWLTIKSAKGTCTCWTAEAAWQGLAIAERERAVWRPLAGARLGCRQLHILAPVSSSLQVRSFWNTRSPTPAWISRKYYAVRLIDAEGNDTPDGSPGEITVSCLHNFAIVLLNYRLGDMGEMSPGACSCGRRLPLLRALHGRLSAAIQLADGRTVTSGSFFMYFKEKVQPALKVQIISPAPGRVCWQIVPAHDADRDLLRRQLLEKSRVVFGPSAEASVEFVDDIPREPSGKFEPVQGAGPRGVGERISR